MIFHDFMKKKVGKRHDFIHTKFSRRAEIEFYQHKLSARAKIGFNLYKLSARAEIGFHLHKHFRSLIALVHTCVRL